ncbi:hypothetical protein [Nonomuraea basaltis]|uniref:hypothetical protein n=1 Tax=Nonomuraea basaltis TaxID=2495887 RepID=UPI00110C5DEB|nr:hypothetical protein [Nonomuraea basaltis]TMR93292.1 hypothetical protein EJK15_40035 [Nonomuraea basaltis]
MLPLTAHELVIWATGWMVGGTRGSSPLSQDRHYLRMDARSSMQAAFVRDGQTASVAGYLTKSGAVGWYVECRKSAEDPRDPGDQPEVEFLPRSWTALQIVFAVAAVLALLYALVRALGGVWWRRRRNWVIPPLRTNPRNQTTHSRKPPFGSR